MAQNKSITQQLLEATKIRLITANKEKTRAEIILWLYQSSTSRLRNYEFEIYMKSIPLERLMTYYRQQDAWAFYREFYKFYDLYAERHPDMTWVEYLETIEVN